ncbi:MAG: tripartite tricarboxylate transporter TctB family protein [Clostridia bacterium]|nr:tripartite tricarboxylate transporter TctB family protein [Clostridia bacterium]
MKRFFKNRQAIDGIVVTCLGIWLLVYSLSNHLNVLSKTSWIMSPYLFPIILASSAILLGLFIFVPAIARQAGQESDSVRIRDVLVILILSIAYDLIMPYIGFIPSTMLLLLGMIAYLGERRPKVLIPIFILTPIILTLIFKYGLGVRLP